MSKFWKETLEVVNTLLQGMPYHGLLLNERYLHHYFSHRIQAGQPKLMELLDQDNPMQFHPEWPTYKEATGINFGKYQKVNCRYLPVESGNKGGFIDFAFGPYLRPEIAVEFKLVFGWQGEAITFDYMKLLDRRNPFKSVLQVTVLMRPNGPANGGRMATLHKAMKTAYKEAVGRLRTNVLSNPATDRCHRFVVTELGPNERRHWYHGDSGGEFATTSETKPVPE